MTRRLSFVAIGGVLLAACSGQSPAPTPTPTVSSVNVSGANSVNVGSTTDMTATAMRADGSTETVTSAATWSSSNSAVATVSAEGRVSAVAPGSSTISATFEGQTGQIGLQVMAVDNVQVVTVTVDSIVIDGTCDTDSIFESSKDGEFTFRFEVERSGTGRTSIWTTDKQHYTKGAHAISGRGIQFTRNVTRGEDFILWFTATEWDGLLGADPKLDGRSLGKTHVYQGDRWVANSSSISLGSGSCGATIKWTLGSRRQ